jgi:hypothetical protein
MYCTIQHTCYILYSNIKPRGVAVVQLQWTRTILSVSVQGIPVSHAGEIHDTIVLAMSIAQLLELFEGRSVIRHV